ncbi:MAG TPA: VOC family protein [Burkholderiales bacterium]|nr:VOC family protein [Burkholderiales bacterium]
MQDQLPPFHLSIPVSDLAKAREFYLDVVGCKEGRSKANRVDFSLFGHHIVAHHMPSEAAHEIEKVVAEGNGERFPVRHFGVIVPMDEWHRLSERMVKAKVRFVMEPQVRYPGEVREQAILLCEDGCGNVLEFKGQPRERIFATG